jgi:hypothetical protein
MSTSPKDEKGAEPASGTKLPGFHEPSYDKGWRDCETEKGERVELIAWVVERWRAEVANRPLVNVNRRPLDDCWRQMLRHLDADDRALLGPTHDELRSKVTTAEWAAMQGGEELDSARDALIDAVAHLAGAASAYWTYACRHPSQGRAMVDAFFSTRAADMDKAVERGRAALASLKGSSC